MSIIVYGESVIGGDKIIQIDAGSWKQFQELVHRGSNLWPDASPEMKEFADKVTIGVVLQDYYAQAGVSNPAHCGPINAYHPLGHIIMQQAINEQSQQVPQISQISIEPIPQFSFAAAIKQFNEMYRMETMELAGFQEIAARLKQFKKMILDEASEIDEIIEKLENPGSSNGYTNDLDHLTDIADVLGDLQVFCASEMERFQLPIDATLQIIMESNASKLQEDGTAMFVEGKLQKGPNYWKPEPRIRAMLAVNFSQIYDEE